MWSSQNGSGPFCAHLASEFDSSGTRYRQASVDVLLPFSRSVIDSAIGFLLATAAVFGSVDPVSFTQSRHVLGHPPAQHVGRVRKERLISFFLIHRRQPKGHTNNRPNLWHLVTFPRAQSLPPWPGSILVPMCAGLLLSHDDVIGQLLKFFPPFHHAHIFVQRLVPFLLLLIVPHIHGAASFVWRKQLF
jgi:hypothetical protein